MTPPARGVGVFGTSGPQDHDQLAAVLGRCVGLRELAGRRGVTLTGDPESLAVLDRELGTWRAEATRSVLDLEVGCYLGTVIVAHVPGARWRVRSDGYPVVVTPAGRELDVISRAVPSRRGRRGSLAAVYVDASR